MDCAALEGLTTRQLLSRLEKLQRYEDSLRLSEMTVAETERVEGMVFKESAEWRQAYQAERKVLSTREHLPGGAARHQRKAARAKLDRAFERKPRRTWLAGFASEAEVLRPPSSLSCNTGSRSVAYS